VTRPSFEATITALTAGDHELNFWPFDDCMDVAEALRHLAVTHQGGPVKDAGEDFWGRCSECGERWPCPSWNEGELLAVQFLGRGQDRIAEHAQGVINRLRERDRERRRRTRRSS
jgi:hypothetical protein